jgi:hypothetical protein
MALALYIPSGEVQLSGNPVLIVVTGAEIPVGATNYQLLLQTTSTDELIAGGPFVDAIAPDSVGTALFDISGYLNIPIVQQFEWPAVGVVVPHPPSILNINVQCGYTYIDANGDSVTSIAGADADMRILKGGLSDFEIGEMNDAMTDFYSSWIEAGKFLTNQPDGAKVSPTQIVKLWYLGQWTANHACTLYMNINTPDKVGHIPYSQNFTIFPTTGLVEININPAFVGRNYYQIESFEVWIEDSVGEVSERRTFLVDNEWKENNNYLFVANGKSGVDVLWLSGAVETSIETNGTEGFKPMSSAQSSRVGTLLATSRTARKKWKINTGYKSSEEMVALVDVYLAYNLWLLIAGKLRPVLLTNGEKLLSDSMEDIHSAELELLEAHNTRFA